MIKQASHIALGSIIVQGATILMYIFLARLLDEIQFATLRQIFLLQSILIAIFVSALPTAMMYFWGRCEESIKKQIIVNQFIIIISCVALSLCLVLFFLSTEIAYLFNNYTMAPLLRVYSIATLGFVASVILPSFLLCMDRLSLNVFFATGIAFLNSVPPVYLAFYNASFESIISIISFTQLSVGIGLFFYMWRVSYHPSFKYSFKRQCSAILKYMWPLMLATTLSIVGLKVDHIIVSGLLGLTLYAIYSVGAFELPLFSIIQNAMTTAIMPSITAKLKSGQINEAMGLWKQANRNVALVTFPIAIIFIHYAELIISLLFSDKYIDAAPIFAVFTILVFLRVMQFGLILKAIGETKQELLANCIYIVISASGAYIMTMHFGVVGAACWVLFSTIILAVLISILTKKITLGNVNVFTVFPLKECILAMLLLLLLWAYSPKHSTVNLSNVIDVISTIFFTVVSWIVVIKTYEAISKKLYTAK